MKLDFIKAIESLKERRKCFFSEADFQLELAWIIKEMYPNAQVRCEYVPEFNPSMHIDILVVLDNLWIPIELKYKTRNSDLIIDNDRYILRNHSARDIGCYLYLHDVQRIESIRESIGDKFSEGYAIMLTNDLAYCEPPHKPDCNYASFVIDEGNIKNGVLNWSDATGEGTKKNYSEPIILTDEYICTWADYSRVDDSKAGSFRYICLPILAKPHKS